MRLNKSDLLEKLRLGEDSYFACKELRFSGERITGPHRDSLADELAAFSNAATQEGVLLLGVKDHTREIVGIPIDKLDTVFIWIRDVCLDLIKPPINPIIERTTLPDSAGIEKPIIRIDSQTDRTTMMDKRGEGVPIILDRSEQLSGKKPLYSLIDQSELLLTIYASNATNASERTSEDG